jgi:ppGpp synthetase/RelA/SpoT-type nucleotidyltranferase
MDTKPVETGDAQGHACQYERLRALYERLVAEVQYVLNERLRGTSVKVAQIAGRAKTVESFKEKVQRKGYKNPLTEATDLAGVRVVCYYETDVDAIDAIITKDFDVHERVDKTGDLGVDKMGYHGRSLVITLGARYQGARYDAITTLKCEIQVRTVLQDSWALISHHLVYKEEESIPQRLRRDLNNVASLLEIAQGVFDTVREKREVYIQEIERTESEPPAFLSQPIDFDTLQAYTQWKFPNLPISEQWHMRLFRDLDKRRYRTLADIDAAVEAAKPAVDQYRRQNPEWFQAGTDFITKSLGFVDKAFRDKHPWGEKTKVAFEELAHLVK